MPVYFEMMVPVSGKDNYETYKFIALHAKQIIILRFQTFREYLLHIAEVKFKYMTYLA